MKESEYADMTNLAKIRAATLIVRDLFPQTERDQTDLRMALKALELWESRLRAELRIT